MKNMMETAQVTSGLSEGPCSHEASLAATHFLADLWLRQNIRIIQIFGGS